MLQCPSSLKQINLKMECFSSLSDKPSIYYKYRGDLLQHSVVNQNNEIQEQWPLATMLLYDNSSMSSLPGAFDSLFGFVSFVLKSPLGIARQWSREKFAILTLKPRSHVRILIYRTTGMPFSIMLVFFSAFFGKTSIFFRFFLKKNC